MYYLQCENKSADKLHEYCADDLHVCFHMCNNMFSDGVRLNYYSKFLDINLRANSAESDQTALISLHYSMVLKHYIMLKQQLFSLECLKF